MTTAIVFYGQFVASKAGKNSLTPTVDVERITRADGTRSALVTGESATAVGRRGLYYYVLTGADLLAYDYVATFITADTSVDQQELAAMWTEWSIPHTTELAYLDAAISSRLAAAGYTTPPTANQVRDAILSDSTPFPGANIDVAISSWAAESSVSDPLLHTVPGSYPSGTAGYALGRIGSGQIATVSPVASDGSVVTYQGDAYLAEDGRAIQWTDASGVWPTLASATVIIDKVIELAATVIPGASQVIQVELSGAQSAMIGAGLHAFQVVGIQADDDQATLVEGLGTSGGWRSQRRMAA